MKLQLFALTAAALIITGASCTGKGAKPKEPLDGPILAESSEVIAPGTQPGLRATLVYFNSEIPVDIDHIVDGSEITLRLLSFNQELEVERYRSTPATFELVQMAGERFDPPLPLLRFPLSEGSQMAWTGKLIIGDLARPAEAALSVQKEPLKAKGYDEGSIKVTVDLKIDGGAPTKAGRTLEFWFVPGKGLLKREIDKGSTRIPVPPGQSGERSS